MNFTTLRRKLHLGTVIGLMVVCYVGFYLIQTIKHNHDLQKQISSLEEQVVSLDEQKQALEYKIQYYRTDAYKEKEARAKLGLQQPGESVVILPRAKPDTQAVPKRSEAGPKKSNIRQWIDFLTGNVE